MPPHIPAIRRGLQGPTKQGHQKELGTPHPWHPPWHICLLRIKATTRRFWLIMLIAHYAQHAIGVAVSDAVHENRHWQHRGAGRLHNWVVPASTGQRAILACLLEFEWHCGGITQLFRQHFMHGHRWHIVHGAGEIMPLVARHWEQVVKLPSFRIAEACVQVPQR